MPGTPRPESRHFDFDDLPDDIPGEGSETPAIPASGGALLEAAVPLTGGAAQEGGCEEIVEEVPLGQPPQPPQRRKPRQERCQRPAQGRQTPGARPQPQRGAAGGQVPESLVAGTIHMRGAVCDADEMTFYKALRKELGWAERSVWGGSGAQQEVVRTPWANGLGSEQVEELRARKLVNVSHVLDLLVRTFKLELHTWLANLYEDESVGLEFHHDGHGRGNVTASASFGAPRDLTFVDCGTGREYDFPQGNGDIFAFDERIDAAFEHGIRKTKVRAGPRISIVVKGANWANGLHGGFQELSRGSLLGLNRSNEIIQWQRGTIARQAGEITAQLELLQRPRGAIRQALAGGRWDPAAARGLEGSPQQRGQLEFSDDFIARHIMAIDVPSAGGAPECMTGSAAVDEAALDAVMTIRMLLDTIRSQRETIQGNDKALREQLRTKS